MHRTVIDFKKPLSIPPGHLIWGLATCAADLESNSICLKERTQIKEGFPGDSRLEAFTEPNVNLSIYPAPFIQSISKNEQKL